MGRKYYMLCSSLSILNETNIVVRRNVSPVNCNLHSPNASNRSATGYIPMWPVLRQLSPEKPAYGNRPINPEAIEYDLWHPRCLKITGFAARQNRL